MNSDDGKLIASPVFRITVSPVIILQSWNSPASLFIYVVNSNQEDSAKICILAV